MKLGKKLGEVATCELPLERFSDGFPVILKVEEPFRNGVKVGEIIGSKNLSLDDGKLDFNLVEPTGMNGTMYENQAGVLVLKTLDGRQTAIGGAVVNDPKQAAGIVIGWAGHDLIDKRSKGAMPLRRSQRPKMLARWTSSAAK